jgi:AcrR family transcriptional regulator
VLRTVGHGQFSVQKVARLAGVYQDNVTYYWPRRRDLVLALAVRVVEDYLRTFDERFDALDPTDEQWAQAIICWIIDDAVSPERVRLLPELWSMANSDPEIAIRVSQAFDDVTNKLLLRIGLTPGTPGSRELRRALVLAGLAAQGLTAVYGHRDPDDARVMELRADLCALHIPALVKARGLAMTVADG